MSHLLFTNRTAIITGSSTGLGRIYAIELAKRGANIVLNDLPPKSLENHPAEQLKNHLKDQYNTKVIVSYNNVLDGEKIVQDTIKNFNQVDILINNAGILADKSFHKLSKEDWYKIINIHLNGTFELCHHAFPHMQQANYGRILTIGSGAGLYGNFGQTNYSSAKMGLVGFTNSLAIEGKKNNILVNCVVPVAASKMTENILPQDILEKLEPDHIAPLITYLSHESCKETGGIFECGAGFYSRIRLERSYGAMLGTKDNKATPEMIANHIDEINDFNLSSHPKTLMESLMGMLETDRVKPTKSAAPSSTSSDATAEAETVNNSVKLASDALFNKIEAFLTSNPGKAMDIAKGLNSKVVFYIKSDDEKFAKFYLIDMKCDSQAIKLINLPSKEAMIGANADLTFTCKDKVFISLAKKDTSAEMAFMRGQLKIRGNISLSQRSGINALLEIASEF